MYEGLLLLLSDCGGALRDDFAGVFVQGAGLRERLDGNVALPGAAGDKTLTKCPATSRAPSASNMLRMILIRKQATDRQI
jgi:hypothetical protein